MDLLGKTRYLNLYSKDPVHMVNDKTGWLTITYDVFIKTPAVHNIFERTFCFDNLKRCYVPICERVENYDGYQKEDTSWFVMAYNSARNKLYILYDCLYDVDLSQIISTSGILIELDFTKLLHKNINDVFRSIWNYCKTKRKQPDPGFIFELCKKEEED